MNRADLILIGANIGATEVHMPLWRNCTSNMTKKFFVTKQEFPFWNLELVHLW